MFFIFNRLKSAISVERIIIAFTAIVFILAIISPSTDESIATVDENLTVVYSYNITNGGDGKYYYKEDNNEPWENVAVLIREDSNGNYIVDVKNVSVITTSTDELSRKGDSHDGYLIADCWLHQFSGGSSTALVYYVPESGDSWIYSEAQHGYACVYNDSIPFILIW